VTAALTSVVPPALTWTASMRRVSKPIIATTSVYAPGAMPVSRKRPLASVNVLAATRPSAATASTRAPFTGAAVSTSVI
jgi:hypothetical protein